MARKVSTPPRELSHRWYLAEWAAYFGKRQADAQRELGWPKANASYLWNSVQRYNQDLMDDVANWLGIKPYELLMPPRDAIALRNIRTSAQAIVAENADSEFVDAPPITPRPARRGQV